MSVAIATMGKFASISCNKQEILVDAGGGGSSYGWERKKPQIIVKNVYDEEDDIRIRITKVTEWS